MAFVADEFTGRRFGKYEVLCRVAVGGMAEIFLGFAHGGPFAFKPVVLKRILSEQREDPTSMQMLIDEAKLTAQLSHPHVAQVLDLEVAGEDVLLVIELIQGANLEELVDGFNRSKEPVPLGLVIAVIRDAAQGLHHAHTYKDAKGNPVPIIHRDVTPRNLMVTFEGVGKVLDFGIARAAGASRRTVAGMVRGTAAYMSPEQAIDAKVDTRSDIFSLGTIFHELLVGQRLFARGNPAKEMAAVYEAEIPIPSIANKRVPKALDAVVLRALERSVSRRYQTPAELIRDLNLAAAGIAFTPERCGEIIKERFAARLRDLTALLDLIPDDPSSAASTDVSRKEMALGEEQLRTLVAPLPTAASAAAAGSASPTTEMELDGSLTMPVNVKSVNARVSQQQRKVPSRPPEKVEKSDKLTTDPARSSDESQVPTRFFTPQFDASKNAGNDRITDEGPVPADVKAPPPTVVTQPGVDPSGSKPPAGSRQSRRHLPPTSDTATQPRMNTGGRTVGLIIGALLAMVLGAAGGVLVYRSVSAQRSPTIGLGRLSIATDRPAEVKLGDEVLHAPIDDVYLPIGHHALAVRENGGTAWRTLEVDVSADRPTRLEVKLDTLPAAP
jgi:serine/threonine protein kinase